MRTNRLFPSLCALSLAFVLVACGSGDQWDDVTAEGLTPEFDDLDLPLVSEDEGGVLDSGLDSRRALYSSSDGARQVLSVIQVAEDDDQAQLLYSNFVEQLANPPPELFFGAEAEQVDAESLSLGTEDTAYVTAEPDDHNNRVWTDVYRTERVVVVTQVLGPDEGEQADLRQTVAERILDGTP